MSNPFEGSVDESYNPFAMTGSYEQPQASYTVPSYESPAAPSSSMDPYGTTPSAAAPESQGVKDSIMGFNLTDKDLQEREEALAKRETKIANREREIQDAKANGTLSSLNAHPTNFPVLLKFYKYYPEEFLPDNSISLVQKIKWITYGGGLMLFLNALVAFFCLAPQVKISSAATTILFSCVYLLVVYPLSLELMLMPLYNALKDGKGMKYVGFMITYTIYIAFFIYLDVGLGDYGSCGWITSIDILGSPQNKWVGGVAIVFSIICILFVVGCGWMWWEAFRYYRANDIQRKAVGEAAVMAGNYAMDHKEQIIEVAKDNPELAMQAAQFAQTNTV